MVSVRAARRALILLLVGSIALIVCSVLISPGGLFARTGEVASLEECQEEELPPWTSFLWDLNMKRLKFVVSLPRKAVHWTGDRLLGLGAAQLPAREEPLPAAVDSTTSGGEARIRGCDLIDNGNEMMDKSQAMSDYLDNPKARYDALLARVAAVEAKAARLQAIILHLPKVLMAVEQGLLSTVAMMQEMRLELQAVEQQEQEVSDDLPS